MSLQFTHIKGDTFDEVAFQLKINDAVVQRKSPSNKYKHLDLI